MAAGLRKTLSDLGYPQPPTYILVDNKVAHGIASNTIEPKRTKTNAFQYCGGTATAGGTQLKNVIISSTVTFVGAYAFHYNTKLTSVVLPTSLRTISYGAFQFCTALQTITIHTTVTFLGTSAFSFNRGLTSVVLPTSLGAIPDWAFESCDALQTITIPTTITFVGQYAFY
eukprot:gene61808-biopygen28643